MSKRYFFENKDGLWMTDDRQLTNDPHKAAYLKDKLEAEIFCSSEKMKEFNITEHEFVLPKNRCVECGTETDNEVWCDMHTKLI